MTTLEKRIAGLIADINHLPEWDCGEAGVRAVADLCALLAAHKEAKRELAACKKALRTVDHELTWRAKQNLDKAKVTL